MKVGEALLVSTYMHTYRHILIYIAPKIVKTNLTRWHKITRW